MLGVCPSLATGAMPRESGSKLERKGDGMVRREEVMSDGGQWRRPGPLDVVMMWHVGFSAILLGFMLIRPIPLVVISFSVETKKTKNINNESELRERTKRESDQIRLENPWWCVYYGTETPFYVTFYAIGLELVWRSLNRASEIPKCRNNFHQQDKSKQDNSILPFVEREVIISSGRQFHYCHNYYNRKCKFFVRPTPECNYPNYENNVAVEKGKSGSVLKKYMKMGLILMKLFDVMKGVGTVGKLWMQKIDSRWVWEKSLSG